VRGRRTKDPTLFGSADRAARLKGDLPIGKHRALRPTNVPIGNIASSPEAGCPQMSRAGNPPVALRADDSQNRDRDHQGNRQCSNTADSQRKEWVFYHRCQCGEAALVPSKSNPAGATR
jgi:hypothetical protein